MNYWLMKSEPDTFGIDDLQNKSSQTEHWDGVRNYQVRNMMRDEMKKGDLAFFYHSNCKIPGIVGIMEIVKEGYPDHTAFDPNTKYFDPKSDVDKPRWFMVDVKFKEKFNKIISLSAMRQDKDLIDFTLLKKGNRLSIIPVSSSEWNTLLKKRT